ncbi:hypothetical protein [Deinococcus apachensis]|uniref:hypothetical protein n=1 Tax=Deinococcus apachensis TaxID=309886 RepID=UPI000374DD11|nr:hypothetical protein [Deinococcus apachensis]
MRASLHTHREAFQQTPWQSFALVAAFGALIVGLSFLLYPEVYDLSKSYTVLKTWWPNAHSLGLLTTLCALAVLLGIAHRIALHGLMGVFLFHFLLAAASLMSVGLSASLPLFVFFAWLAFTAYIRSGGLRLRRHRCPPKC